MVIVPINKITWFISSHAQQEGRKEASLIQDKVLLGWLEHSVINSLKKESTEPWLKVRHHAKWEDTKGKESTYKSPVQRGKELLNQQMIIWAPDKIKEQKWILMVTAHMEFITQ